MEPFSFFQILQSFLPKQTAPDPVKSESESEAPVQEPPTATAEAEQSDAQNAFLHFMETHDKRIKRTRK